MTLVDTNVLLDIVTQDPVWAGWSLLQLDRASLSGAITVNDVIYAELSVRYDRIKDVDAALDTAGIVLDTIPRPALFLAGKAFKKYKLAGGTRTGVLPDFFVGAHAAVSGLPLLTRDPRRYRTDFPSVALLTPEN